MIRITVDTNMLGSDALDRVEAAARQKGLAVEIQTVTVNKRERGHSANSAPTIPETMVWGESKWDEGVWGESRTVHELFVFDETPLGAWVGNPPVGRAGQTD